MGLGGCLAGEGIRDAEPVAREGEVTGVRGLFDGALVGAFDGARVGCDGAGSENGLRTNGLPPFKSSRSRLINRPRGSTLRQPSWA